jgi:excisionase family DNA binding protein
MNVSDRRFTHPSTEVGTEAAGFATPVEAAKFLRLSRAMVHKLIGEGKMPACRYGRSVRIPWAWLRTQAESASAQEAQ